MKRRYNSYINKNWIPPTPEQQKAFDRWAVRSATESALDDTKPVVVRRGAFNLAVKWGIVFG